MSTFLQTPGLFMGACIGAAAVLLPMGLALYTFISNFVTKADLKARDERLDKIEARFASDLALTEARLTVTLGENRRVHESHYVSQGAKLDSLTQTMQLFTNEMSRVVGSLEGRAEGAEKLIEKLVEKSLPPAHV